MISCMELLLVWPWVLNLVYLSVQETDYVCHLLENKGQVVSDFTIKLWLMGPKVSLSNPFY